MKGQFKVATPAEYLAKLKEPRKSEVTALDALIRKSAPEMEPYIHSGLLAYGWCTLTYASGKKLDWFRIGVASNASYISLYICAMDGKNPIAQKYKKSLPKAKIGRACTRFKRLADLDQKALVRLIKEVAKA